MLFRVVGDALLIMFAAILFLGSCCQKYILTSQTTFNYT